MRVLQIMECTIGGTRRHLRDLVHGLKARGVEVQVACSDLREPAVREDLEAMRVAGVSVQVVPMVRAIQPLRDGWHLLRLAALMAGRGLDVVHTHSSKAGALGRAAALLASRARRVHTPHTFAFSFQGGQGQGGQAAGPRGFLLGAERRLGRSTHRFIHVSSGERDEGQRLGVVPPGLGAVVHNGVDPAAYAGPQGGAALRAELGIPPDAPLLGSVGLLNDAKGYDRLLEAAALLSADVHVLLVGSGERLGALQAQARRLGLERRVHLPGWRVDLGPVHDALDLFVLPSRWEGLAYSLLEAMAAGLPCVSSDVNGSREVLAARSGEAACGLVVPAEEPARLAEALAGLLRDPRRRQQLGRAAAARVARDYTVERMVDGVLKVYEEVIGGR